MAWLLFIVFLFFAWRAAACFRQGRPKPAIIALGGCALMLAGIFTDYMMLQRQMPEAAPPAMVEEPALAEAPLPTPEPAAMVQDPDEIEAFYGNADAPIDEAADDEFAADEMVVD